MTVKEGFLSKNEHYKFKREEITTFGENKLSCINEWISRFKPEAFPI